MTENSEKLYVIEEDEYWSVAYWEYGDWNLSEDEWPTRKLAEDAEAGPWWGNPKCATKVVKVNRRITYAEIDDAQD